MHTLAFILNVMFAVYASNVVGSFAHSFAARCGERAVFVSDLLLGGCS